MLIMNNYHPDVPQFVYNLEIRFWKLGKQVKLLAAASLQLNLCSLISFNLQINFYCCFLYQVDSTKLDRTPFGINGNSAAHSHGIAGWLQGEFLNMRT